MLDIKDIHTYYGKSYVLQGVSLPCVRGNRRHHREKRGGEDDDLCGASWA